MALEQTAISMSGAMRDRRARNTDCTLHLSRRLKDRDWALVLNSPASFNNEDWRHFHPDRAISACSGRAWIGKVTAMSGIFASLTLEGKRIRPEKPVIKCGIFPPNYS